jgi:hypothetical protein
MEHQTNLLFNQDTSWPENPYSSPLEALRALLGNFWLYRTEEDALKQWGTYVQESSLQARVLLKNLDVLCNDPPKNLPEILQDDGWIYLYHEENWILYSLSEHVEWLTHKTAQLRGIYEEEHSSPAGVLRTVRQNFWLDRSDAIVLDEWKTYVKQAPRKAQIILQKLAAVIDTPPLREGDKAMGRKGETATTTAVKPFIRLSVSPTRPLLTSPLAVTPRQIGRKSGRLMAGFTSIMMETDTSQAPIHSQSMSNGLDK